MASPSRCMAVADATLARAQVTLWPQIPTRDSVCSASLSSMMWIWAMCPAAATQPSIPPRCPDMIGTKIPTPPRAATTIVMPTRWEVNIAPKWTFLNLTSTRWQWPLTHVTHLMASTTTGVTAQAADRISTTPTQMRCAPKIDALSTLSAFSPWRPASRNPMASFLEFQSSLTRKAETSNSTHATEVTTFRPWAANSTVWSLSLVCGAIATEPCRGLMEWPDALETATCPLPALPILTCRSTRSHPRRPSEVAESWYQKNQEFFLF